MHRAYDCHRILLFPFLHSFCVSLSIIKLMPINLLACATECLINELNDFFQHHFYSVTRAERLMLIPISSFPTARKPSEASLLLDGACGCVRSSSGGHVVRSQLHL